MSRRKWTLDWVFSVRWHLSPQKKVFSSNEQLKIFFSSWYPKTNVNMPQKAIKMISTLKAFCVGESLKTKLEELR
jgi:hypothetical protein